MDDGMWVVASGDHEFEEDQHKFARAKVEAAEVLPFLAKAASLREFDQRQVLVADDVRSRVTAALETTDEAEVDHYLSRVIASQRADFDQYLQMKAARPGNPQNAEEHHAYEQARLHQTYEQMRRAREQGAGDVGQYDDDPRPGSQFEGARRTAGSFADSIKWGEEQEAKKKRDADAKAYKPNTDLSQHLEHASQNGWSANRRDANDDLTISYSKPGQKMMQVDYGSNTGKTKYVGHDSTAAGGTAKHKRVMDILSGDHPRTGPIFASRRDSKEAARNAIVAGLRSGAQRRTADKITDEHEGKEVPYGPQEGNRGVYDRPAPAPSKIPHLNEDEIFGPPNRPLAALHQAGAFLDLLTGREPHGYTPPESLDGVDWDSEHERYLQSKGPNAFDALDAASFRSRLETAAGGHVPLTPEMMTQDDLQLAASRLQREATTARLTLASKSRTAGKYPLDMPVSQVGMSYDKANAQIPEVAQAKTWTGWNNLPTTKVPIKGLNATEEAVASHHVNKVVNGEPFRQGYDPYVMIDKAGKSYLIDGHHRAVMYGALGNSEMPAHVLDLRKQSMGSKKTAAPVNTGNPYSFVGPGTPDGNSSAYAETSIGRPRALPPPAGQTTPTSGVDLTAPDGAASAAGASGNMAAPSVSMDTSDPKQSYRMPPVESQAVAAVRSKINEITGSLVSEQDIDQRVARKVAVSTLQRYPSMVKSVGRDHVLTALGQLR